MCRFNYNERHIEKAKKIVLYHTAPMQDDVEMFMGVSKQQVAMTIGPADLNLRKRLIVEEVQEFVDAVEADDFPAMVDALADILYVTYGTFVAFGVNAKQVCDLVHDANMAKLGGPKDEHGKQLKPEGWVAPDVAGLLRAMGWKDEKA